jgi:hypothetical protein
MSDLQMGVGASMAVTAAGMLGSSDNPKAFMLVEHPAQVRIGF